MNPVRLVKIYRRANKLLSLFEAASKESDMGSKAIWKSKTFWFNALTAAVELTQVLPLPVGTVAAIAAVANIGLRLISNQPVHIVPPMK